jgi:hypothetical protein
MSRYIDADEFLENESEAYMRAQVNLAKEHADKTIDPTRYVNSVVHKKIQMLINEAPAAEVVEVSKILKTADEQEKQGFIQTAMILRKLVEK